MLRHALVAFPLINYVDKESDMMDQYLFDSLVKNKEKMLEQLEESFMLTPRHIHYDEIEIFIEVYKIYCAEESICEAEKIDTITKIRNLYDIYFNENNTCKNTEIKKYKNITTEIYRVGNMNKGKLRIAIANMDVKREDIRRSYCQDKRPNLSIERQNILYEIMNAANKEKTELLVLPELSIPHRWLPFMVSYARRYQIGMIFGLEHWVIGRKAHNLLVTILPYKEKDQYKNASVFIREKNHYSPEEIRNIRGQRLEPGEPVEKRYYMFKWEGVCFAPYSCFELCDIEHRSLFKSKIDLMTACVWNKDTRYFGNIIESVSRDMHCYVVQTNSSQFGDSRVTSPRKTDIMDIIKVKGGENTTILTATLDIDDLREYQAWENETLKEEKYKPTPPGYDKEDDRLLDYKSINSKQKIQEKSRG